jgi:zinc/manganese transport system substrate-binding protein
MALVLGVLGLGLATITACGSDQARGGDANAVQVVSSTNVYGDLVASVAGDLAGRQVTIASIISDPAQDPHSYTASARVRLAIDKADIVIMNGGGYDDFVTELRGDTADSDLIDAVQVTGHKPVDGELNEHVWYDLNGMRTLVDRIATALGEADPSDATTFIRNAGALKGQLSELIDREAQLKADHTGTGVAITEPVPLYLLTDCGLVNRTPADFSEAIEEGDGVAPRVLNETLRLFSDHRVALLAYNEQATGPETERVLAAADKYAIPVVAVTETLPPGQHFVGWMSGTLDAVAKALG